MAIPQKYTDAIATSEGPEDAGWDYKQFSGPYGTKRGPNEHVSQEEGYRRFQTALGDANNYVRSLGVPMSTGQEAALTSLTYNAGPGWIKSGLGQAVRNQDWQRARQLFLQYDHAGGERNPGLTRRRQQEVAWWDEGGDGTQSSHPAYEIRRHTPDAQSEPSPPDPTDYLAFAGNASDDSDDADTPNPGITPPSKEPADVGSPPITQSSTASLVDPTTPLRIQRALDMAAAATPYVSKVGALPVPKLKTDKPIETASLEEEAKAMGGLDEPFRRTFAGGGVADDNNPWLGTRQSNNIDDRTQNYGDTLGAIYDQAAAVPGQFANFLGRALWGRPTQGKVLTDDDYQQASDLMPKTEGHPYTGPAYETPKFNQDDGYHEMSLAPKSAIDLDGPQNYANGGATPAWFARQEARGMTHAGPLMSAVPGRTDQLPISVKAGSYVVPADVVSALGEGNTSAGNNILKAMFTGPFGMPTLHSRKGVGSRTSISRSRGGYKAPSPIPQIKPTKYADGGVVPIIAAGGEYVIDPDQVAQIGDGDIDTGHQILDQFVKQVRADHIQTLQGLPGPNK
jgi:lysozyme